MADQPKLKGYVFTERLGSGTYSTVYKAFKNVRTSYFDLFFSFIYFININWLVFYLLLRLEYCKICKMNLKKVEKIKWARRDLNTQPSDLESDALPLRHRPTLNLKYI